MIIIRDGLAWKIQDDGYQVTVSPGEAADEINRLRAELATWKKAHIELGEMHDRLRAENAELRKGLSEMAVTSWISVEARKMAAAILAKTVKEGNASASSSDPEERTPE